jgi:hypothetical protein
MICIGFYCDVKPTNKTVIPWLVRTTLSTVLYEIIVCMKFFNMSSPKFDEQDETNLQSIEVAHRLHSVMASRPVIKVSIEKRK